jgi:hypothetical protein
MPLDEVGVVGRLRGPDEYPAGLRIERDGGAAVPGERVLRGLLGARIDRRDDVVAPLRDPPELVERVVEKRVEVRVRARQVVVQRLLEPRARALDRRVADGPRCELTGGIRAEVPRAAELLLLHLSVAREGRLPVRGEDRAPVDRELLDDQLRVALARLEVGRLPEPVRRHDDERDEEADEDEEEPANLGVHVRSRFTRSETMRRRARMMKLATMLDPP